jgi:two-component system, LuxR family, sensor kinase FixL
MDLFNLIAPKNRTRSIVIAALIIAAIATADWGTKRYVSLGFLYLFPIMFVGGCLSRGQIVGLSALCAVLHEAFSAFPEQDPVRTVMVAIAFAGTGLFVSELVRNRQLAIGHLLELEKQIQFRRDAEDQLDMLIETSPAAILTMNSEGAILLANEAAEHLFDAERSLKGQAISSYLPDLHAAVLHHGSKVLRTTMQCKGQRRDGETFLAAVWFSTFTTSSGLRVAAIIVDLSEELRDREELSLNHVLKNTRLLVGAVCHEIGNFCAAISVVHKNLSLMEGLPENRDFQTLGTLADGLKKIASTELKPSSENSVMPVNLREILDELRILIENSFRESGATVKWNVPEELPMVWADRYGLLQVFLNISRNSQRAMETMRQREMVVRAAPNAENVVVYFEDTGRGIADPDGLFRPFRTTADVNGIGLYVSRAILRTFRGELRYEPRPAGSCFAAVLTAVTNE